MPEARKISAKEVVGDVKRGMTEAEIIKKYRLSSQGLQSLLAKLLLAGHLTEIDLRKLRDEVHTSEETSQTRSFELIEVVPEFPRNLLQFRQYDGAKTITAAIFLLAVYWFITGFFGQPAEWYQVWRPLTDFLGFAVRSAFLFVSYLILWVTFDRRNVEGYALSWLAALFGLVYIISPTDFVPDVPPLGMLDDAAIGGGAIWLGVKNYMRERFQKQKAARIKDCLGRGDVEKALELFAEDRGFILRSGKRDGQA